MEFCPRGTEGRDKAQRQELGKVNGEGEVGKSFCFGKSVLSNDVSLRCCVTASLHEAVSEERVTIKERKAERRHRGKSCIWDCSLEFNKHNFFIPHRAVGSKANRP